MLQCNTWPHLCNLSSRRSKYYSLKNIIRVFAVMTEKSENCQLHTETTLDAPVNNPLVPEAKDDTKQELDAYQQNPEDEPKSKKKKSKLKPKDVCEKRQKPNYFIGIKVCNKEIIDNSEKMQQYLVNKHSELERTLISLPTLHLTLAVMHLDDEDEDVLKKCSEAMGNCLKVCGPGLISAPLILTFEGLGHFPSGVVYSKVKEGHELNRLTEIARQIRESFVSHGIPIHDQTFTPHLTLLKASKLQGKWRKNKGEIKKIFQAELYEEHKNLLFGTEEVLNIQLLSMNKEKDETGYYSCLQTISFVRE